MTSGVVLPHADSSAVRRDAIARLAAGDSVGARQLLREAAARSPRDSDLHELLGVAECSTGELERGIAALERAVELSPARASHRVNLGKALRDAGDAARALPHLELAVSLAARDATAWHHLGLVRQAQGDHDGAATALAQAVELDGAEARAALDLGGTLALQGRMGEAHAAYGAFLARARDDGLMFRSATLLPPIMDSTDGIEQWRTRYREGLRTLADMKLRLEDPVVQAGVPGFFLAYHGLCNRDLHVACADALRAAAPALEWRAAYVDRWREPRGRIRVGFLSQHFREHSIARTSRGLMARLDRARFEVLALCLPPASGDALARAVRSAADRVVELPGGLAEAREVIAALELDVLFYQDIGLEPLSYYLAFARLAPVQCVSFGHPDTTGLPEMDWFVSNDLYEPDGAVGHYSERLFLLHDLPTLAWYDRPPAAPAEATRESLGLPADRTLYLCPQTLFKLHPDLDAALLRILRDDPRGDLVLVRPQVGRWLQTLLARLHRAAPWVLDRIHVVPMLDRARFIALLGVADVVLDTPHFNGMNSSLESFAAGAPVVTVPGTLQRARHTAAMYRAMRLEQEVADSLERYAEVALALGRDVERREALRCAILERNDVLFANDRVVREFERFFEAAVASRAAQ
jgi:predicted O-linked N-acetylglucosamine transferase (SPINDLY family)